MTSTTAVASSSKSPDGTDSSYGYSPQYPLVPFTEFDSVTPDTPLESLNLNWREQDLPERIRTKHVHRLHPYLGKFIPQIVEIFLRKFEPTTVCDPFCGSGTTLVEAASLGINAIGCDISEFNTLMTKVKTANYDLDLLESRSTRCAEPCAFKANLALCARRQQRIRRVTTSHHGSPHLLLSPC